MAQRTEKEETEFKVPETLTLCINNCGVTGNPATNNMCQNCFNATTAASSSSSSTSGPSAGNGGAGVVARGPILRKATRSGVIRLPDRGGSSSAAPTSRKGEDGAVPDEKKVVNRCSGCKRKVGLTGFRCRCGELFCAEHRYSDRHDCSYDYKAAGREAIARENPVVKAAKILKV